MRSQIIVGIDVGTWATKVVVAERSERGGLEILGTGFSYSSGLRRGMIVDLAEAAESSRLALEEARRVSGVEIEEVRAVVGSVESKSKPSHAMVAVSRADSEISPEDVGRVLKEAQLHVSAPNRAPLAVVAREFIVDGESHIQDPVGMSGMRLEVNALVLETSSSFLKNLSRLLSDAGVEVERFCPVQLAGSAALLDRKRRELGVLAMDLGGATTNLSIFEEDEIVWSEVLPVGAMHITNDLAIGLKTAVEIAEEVKVEYGYASAKGVGKEERVDLAKFGGGLSGGASRRLIAEIIEARLHEIFLLVAKALKSTGKARLLPGGMVLFGGGAKLLGIGEVAKRALKLPVALGFPKDLKGVVDRVEDPIFANSLGAVLHSAPFGEGRELKTRLKGWEGFKKLWRIFSP